MKNRIKKRRLDSFDSPFCSTSGANQNGVNLIKSNLPKIDKSIFLYNLKSIAVIIEVLVGAILGIALCFGFFFAFFVVRGSLIFSLGAFLLILIIAAFFVLVLKYMFVLIFLKLREIELLEKIARK